MARNMSKDKFKHLVLSTRNNLWTTYYMRSWKESAKYFWENCLELFQQKDQGFQEEITQKADTACTKSKGWNLRSYCNYHQFWNHFFSYWFPQPPEKLNPLFPMVCPVAFFKKNDTIVSGMGERCGISRNKWVKDIQTISKVKNS